MASGGSEPEEDVWSSEDEALNEGDDFSEEETISENSEPDNFSTSESTTEQISEASGIEKTITFPCKIWSLTQKQLSKSTFASLLNDYVESEFFAIDGDSLLITCATNCSLLPGQSLHFFYLVEQFLFNLKSRNARFVIVFFQDFKDFYHPYPLLRCRRTQLKLYIQKNTDIAVYTFSSFLSKEWNTFIREQAPYFFMVSDEGLTKYQTLYLNMVILHALGNQIDVVLTNAQESEHLRVYGYYVKSSILIKKFIQMNASQLEETLQEIITTCKSVTPQQSFFLQCMQEITEEKEVQNCISLLSTVLNDNCDIRVATCIVSCSLALRIHARTENCHDQNDDNPHLTLEEAADLCRMQCLSVAMRIILPLCQRAKIRRIKGKWNKDAQLFIGLQQRCDHIALGLLRDHFKKTEINWTHVSDIRDDLLLKNIAYYYEKEYNADFKLEFGEKINESYTFLWTSILKLVPHGEHLLSYELRTTKKPFLTPEAYVGVDQEDMLPTGLLPMRNNVIEEYAGDAIKELPILSSHDPVFTSLLGKKPYDELLHWHSGRPLSDDYDRTKNEQHDMLKDKWALKRYQKLQSFNYRFGQTLGVKKATKILVQNDKPEEKKCAYNVPEKKKQHHVKKKDQIIEERLKLSKAVKENKEQQQWNNLAPSLKKELRGNFNSGISKFDKAIHSLQTQTVKYQARKELLAMCFEIWTEHCKTVSEDQRDMNFAVQVMKIIQSIVANHNDMLQEADKHRVAGYLTQLGFQNLACTLKGSEVTSKECKKNNYAVGVGSARFQMKYMGPYLQRDERKDPDPRVQHFIPDTWQRELLDVVDNNESAIIVAPTSSGKTYASYYCMEKVLRQSNDGIVVYVAPTKALVNQVVATVSSQFQKDLPGGMALCGVFTRDYRHDALNCQVLVTVPQCLEILLLSPHRQDWVKKIKYLIFDEVHCLGGEVGAEVWEHLLVMIRCPFLALSATISNPEHLTEWLQSIKRYWQQIDENEISLVTSSSKKGRQNKQLKAVKRSYRVRLVRYDKRYNDLETYICSVQNSNMTFDHYHPFSALTIDHVKNYGVPKDLTCSPRECIQLYDAMAKVWPTCTKMETLDPEKNIHLKDKVLITKNDAIKYQEDLKSELVDWIENGHCTQNQINKLPALFFAFSLPVVEGLARELYCHLRAKQKEKQTPQDEKEIQKLQEKADKLAKGLQSVDFGFLNSERAVTRKQESQVTKAENYNVLKKRLQKLREIPPDCTYADEKAVDNITLEIIHRGMITRNHTRFDNLIAFSRRGIGYHHASVDAKGRRFVEMLFRMGYIKVVTATGSLALGINMPCKSVVFLHDSVYLDALNYRQMAGRAGRRGLDLEGSVYFFNIPVPKVKKLMKSNVPELRGQFPLSISLVLRLMLLAAKADDKEDAKAKVLSILKHSLMTFKHPNETQVLKLFCVFSLQFLLYEQYLNQDCSPTEFTGLATHLHYHEPSNFIFITYLENGLFHKLCKPLPEDPTKFSDSVMETLVLILANLFTRSYLAPSRRSSGKTFHQSKVYLEELPEDFATAVKEYNKKVAKIFGHCILTASKLADMEKEYRLPLTQISFSGKEYKDSSLVDHLMPHSEGRKGISPFACLSGNTDHDLMKMTNISSLMLQTAQIPEKYIPIFHLTKEDVCGRKIFLNSYALDFYKHGSLEALRTDNGLNQGEAYCKLKDFMLTIASISISMKEMCEDENDPVALAFDQLHEIYSEKFQQV
ncbi:probable ATP-dependent RNA helicase DDX60 [Pyxicephalus adspersus]|uniref:probable ATP-dependent RNA helicase DDX60 n=1 Tax=Pyxicephalus adspersus TaxID=30357 RepID=UPI003B59B5D0